MDEKASTPNKSRRWTLAGVAAATVAAAGAAFAWHGDARGHGAFGGRHGHFGGPFGGSMDPEAMSKRIDAMVQWMLADVDATPAQRDKVSAIAKAAAQELAPLRGKHFEARRKTIELLAQPTIDRTQIEQIRVEQLQLGETVTRRMTQALVDAAEVLTPEQRAKLAQKWSERRHRHG